MVDGDLSLACTRSWGRMLRHNPQKNNECNPWSVLVFPDKPGCRCELCFRNHRASLVTEPILDTYVGRKKHTRITATNYLTERQSGNGPSKIATLGRDTDVSN